MSQQDWNELPYKPDETKWHGEICRKCGKRNAIIWSVTDAFWEAVVGEETVWCLACFDEEAQKRGVRYKLDSEPKLRHLKWCDWW